MEEARLCQWSTIRSLFAILQWWGFNVTVIIMNKWIFQVLLSFRYFLHFLTCCFSIGLILVEFVCLFCSLDVYLGCELICLFSFRFGFLQKLDFKFPLTVSCIHFICSAVGAYMAIKVLKVKPLISVDPEDRWRRIFPMSFVFCINIVLGNVSLRYIPVSFMQTIKSFTPATTGAVLNLNC